MLSYAFTSLWSDVFARKLWVLYRDTVATNVEQRHCELQTVHQDVLQVCQCHSTRQNSDRRPQCLRSWCFIDWNSNYLARHSSGTVQASDFVLAATGTLEVVLTFHTSVNKNIPFTSALRMHEYWRFCTVFYGHPVSRCTPDVTYQQLKIITFHTA